MKAAIYTRHGSPDVVRITEVAKPEAGGNGPLVKVEGTTVNRTDCGYRAAKPFILRFFAGLRRPKPKRRILGKEFAGEVEAVGIGVTSFEVGDTRSTIWLTSSPRSSGWPAVARRSILASSRKSSGEERRDDPLDGLTAREREVLELMAEGLSNSAIAARVFLTNRGVEKQVTSIFQELRLPVATDTHRRVLAVVAFLQS